MELTGTIRVRSERQAMDWSLVLASQGIAATILAPAEEHGWLLCVDPPELSRAQWVLRLYNTENRSRIWVRKLPWTGLVFDWRGVAWFALLSAIFLLEQTRFPYLRAAGIMDGDAVRAGQWWRLFTATMLHADVGHLAANVSTGILLLGLAMGGYGPGLALLGACLAGVVGNVVGLFLYPSAHFSLGASGMVMGALGLLAAQSFPLVGQGLPGRQMAVRGLCGGALLLVLFGLSPQPRTDLVAHVGGFIFGAGLGALLGVLSWRPAIRLWSDRLAEGACALLVILTWWLALR